MMRSILILASVLFLAAPASAENSPSSSGRYQLVPDGDGFIRLDAKTGALAHCDKRDGAWRCDTLAVTDPDREQAVDALADDVSSLSETVDRLAERLDRIDERLAAAGIAAPQTEEQQEQDLDQALTFAERLMRRFFDFVRELKNEEPPQRI